VSTVLIPAARGRLRLAQGRAADALADFLACEALFGADAWGMPIHDTGYVHARSGAALALLQLDRRQDACQLAARARDELKAACAQFFAGWFGAFPDAHVEVHRVHMTGDVVVEEGTFTGTHHGILHTPAGDIPPTGRRVAVDYIHVLRYRDGLHVSFNLLFDRLLMLDQFGLVPAPAATG